MSAIKPAKLDLCITKGITFRPVEIVFKTNGAVVPLTGYKCYATAENSNTKLDLEPVFDEANAKATIAFDDEETFTMQAGRYRWTAILESPDGESHGPYVAGILEIVTTTTVPSHLNA